MKRPYQNLVVWQETHKLCLSIYQISKNFPSDEKFGLSSQIRRSACSIPTNIAEANGRRTAKDRKNFLTIAGGSLEELHYQCTLAHDLGYIETIDLNELHNLIQRSGYLLHKLHASL